MSEPKALVLEHRGVLAVDGPDARAFLQGIVSNDVEKATPESAVWSAFLTPQGKFLHEFFMVERDGRLLLDCEAERRADLMKRLRIYKLRSKAEVADETEGLCVVALWDGDALSRLGLEQRRGAATGFAGGAVFVDPRLTELGARALVPRERAAAALTELGFRNATLDDYDRHRIALGAPDGSRDLEVEKTTLLEAGFDELGGVDWQKGCYMGQELTARTKYRGLVKRRLVPVEIDGPAPSAGAPILVDGKESGTLRSVVDGVGLATLRLDQLAESDTEFAAGEARLKPRKPDWANF
jgi:folate-binding protein YgfZ